MMAERAAELGTGTSGSTSAQDITAGFSRGASRDIISALKVDYESVSSGSPALVLTAAVIRPRSMLRASTRWFARANRNSGRYSAGSNLQILGQSTSERKLPSSSVPLAYAGLLSCSMPIGVGGG